MFDIKFSTQNENVLKRLSETIPRATEYALEQVLGTLKVKVQGRTPEGIRYKAIKRKKGGEPVKGASGQGRWVKSGILKRSWEAARAGTTITVGTNIPYAGILEVGGYPGIGKPRTGMMSGGEGQVSPRTTAEGGKIWSSRAVGGILKPLIDDKAFIDGIVARIIREMNKNLRAAQ